MKKILALALVFILALSLLAACGGGNDNNGGGNNNGKFEYGNGEDFIAANLKGDYSISYKYSVSSTGGAGQLEVQCIRTSAGYYFSYGGMEQLYIKNGDKYDKYFRVAGMDYTKIDTITQKEVESEISMVTGFMTQYGDDTSGMKKDGSATVAGRNCDKYTGSGSGIGVTVKWSYYIDKETGVCLKYDLDQSVGQVSVTFECTEFKTSGVSLPSYK